MLRERMWWFHRDARFVDDDNGVRQPCGELVSGTWKFDASKGRPCPEAGQVLHYQHDGARPHTAKSNARAFASHSKMRGFAIEMVVQPAQSPDLNIQDLAFFHSRYVSLVAKESRKNLLSAVTDCWDGYDAERIESVWRCLYASYKGVLSDGGGNQYSKHQGVRSAHKVSSEDDLDLGLTVCPDLVASAEAALEQLEDSDMSSAGSSSDDEPLESDAGSDA